MDQNSFRENNLPVFDEQGVTQELVEAGVKALYSEMGYQLSGSPEDGVRAVLELGLRAWRIAEMHPLSIPVAML